MCMCVCVCVCGRALVAVFLPRRLTTQDEHGHLKELSVDRAEREAVADQLLTPQSGDATRCKKVFLDALNGVVDYTT